MVLLDTRTPGTSREIFSEREKDLEATLADLLLVELNPHLDLYHESLYIFFARLIVRSM